LPAPPETVTNHPNELVQQPTINNYYSTDTKTLGDHDWNLRHRLQTRKSGDFIVHRFRIGLIDDGFTLTKEARAPEANDKSSQKTESPTFFCIRQNFVQHHHRLSLSNGDANAAQKSSRASLSKVQNHGHDGSAPDLRTHLPAKRHLSNSPGKPMRPGNPPVTMIRIFEDRFKATQYPAVVSNSVY
jgi:hypothetical protein